MALDYNATEPRREEISRTRMDRDDNDAFVAESCHQKRAWYITAKRGFSLRDVLLIAASWAVLIAYFLYPAFYLGAGVAALVVFATGHEGGSA